MNKKNKKVLNFYKKEVLKLSFDSESSLLNPNSHFTKPTQTGREYFSFFDTENEETLKGEFLDYYRRKGVELPNSFIEKLAKLSFQLKNIETKDNTDLPDYIYIMH